MTYTIEELESYLNQIIDKKEYVLGEIYAIRNKKTGMQYIGQTLSHRLNHGRYRPYGYEKRFKSHISEAQCNTKETQCRYLANAIRIDGPGEFEVKLLTRCFQSQMDDYEMELIEQYGTQYPNGYNLAKGGKYKCTKVRKEDLPDGLITHPPQPRNAPRSEDVKQKMLDGRKLYIENNRELFSQKTASNALQQHLKRKLDEFRTKNITIPIDANYSDYMKWLSDRCNVVIQGHKTAFYYGKNETKEDTEKRVISFLKELQIYQT